MKLLVGGALVALCGPLPALAQETIRERDTAGGDALPVNVETAPRPFAAAVVAGAKIQVDGRLDESAWSAARPITEFIQSQPRPGYPATERTVVRILYDERALYIGALCYDSDPSALTVLSLEQDFPGQSTRDSDIFGVTLDPFLDRRNSFMFLVNPRGAYRDGQTFNDSRQEDFAWRAVVDIKTTVHDSGWTVEMAIPWTSLRFDGTHDEQQWGMNLLRRIRRKNEDALWAPVDRRDPVHRMSRAGTLTGLRHLRRGRNLTVKPFVLGSSLSGQNAPGGAAQSKADAGVDLKYGLTPGLTLDLTYRTDFSQADVDQERVNLTRFPLFFPEQRDFFVENSGSFLLGNVTERNYRTGSSLRDFTLFHSRRIGLTADGRPIPLLGGARITGRIGGMELGLLDVQTRGTDAVPAENFGVVRLRRNLAGSDVGLMVINREATEGAPAYNRTFGADANLRLLGHMIVNSYVAGTAASDGTGDQRAARLAVGWRDQVWDITAFVNHIGDGFDPGVGFVRRAGVRHLYATAGAHPRPRLSFLQEINPYVEGSAVTDLSGVLQTREGALGFGAQFRDGSVLSTELVDRFERIEAPFAVGGVGVPVGDYAMREARVSYESNRGRALGAELSVSGGDFWGGQRRSVSADVSWRAHYRLTIEAAAAHDNVELPGGAFTADVLRGRVRVASSTRLFGSAFVQYNNQTEQLVTNVRLNWIYAPLSDVFLVLSERRDLAAGVVLDRAVTVKATRLFAF